MRTFDLPVEVGLEPLRVVDEFAPPKVRRNNRLDWLASDICSMLYEDVLQFEKESGLQFHPIYLWAKGRRNNE
jgi:hypothetical protein